MRGRFASSNARTVSLGLLAPVIEREMEARAIAWTISFIVLVAVGFWLGGCAIRNAPNVP
jgi:hypothetical protein